MGNFPEVFDTDQQRVLAIESPAVEGADTWALTALSGREGLSQLYEFDLEIDATDELDIDALLKAPVDVFVRNRGKVRRIHGRFAALELVEVDIGRLAYRGQLVPRLWYLSLSRHNRVFQNQTVLQTVAEVFEQHGLAAKTDYEIRCIDSYPEREFCVQYDETDLDFVCRQLQHVGIGFFFEQAESAAKLVLADGAHAYRPLPERELDFLAPGMGGQADHINRLLYRQRVAPKRVTVSDYNYRMPAMQVKGAWPVDDAGRGELVHYGEHVKDEREAGRIARVRAEAIAAMQKLYEGSGSCPSFLPGATFTLDMHPLSRFNQRYLLVEVTHQARQSREPGSDAADGHGYRNGFRAIVASVPFRPPLRTPKPRIHGVMHAHVDSAGSGQYADIDEQGRYRVRLPLDEAGAQAGQASRLIRMAQPYAGAGYGQHFPLHKQTEVLLTFIDGDIDRPIIAAAVPNAATPGPVAGANATQAIISTAGGNVIRMEDTQGSEHIFLSTPHGNTSLNLGKGSQGYTIRTDNDAEIDVKGKHTEHIQLSMDLTVDQTLTESVGGHRIEKVLLTANELVGLSKTVNVGGMFETGVGGSLNLNVGVNMNEMVIGWRQEQVLGGSKKVYVRSKMNERFGQHQHTVQEEYALSADDVRMEARGKNVVVQAAEQIELVCGDAMISLKKDGTITIVGKTIQVSGTDITTGAQGKITTIADGDIETIGKSNVTTIAEKTLLGTGKAKHQLEGREVEVTGSMGITATSAQIKLN